MVCAFPVHSRASSHGGLSGELRNTDFSWHIVIVAGVSKLPLIFVTIANTTVVLLPTFRIKGYPSFQWFFPSKSMNP